MTQRQVEPEEELSLRARIGIQGEAAACKYLIDTGYRIVNQNWKCRVGELDIIALKNKCLTIIEVKTRKEGAYGDFSPFAAVNYTKEAKIKRLAEIYLEFNKFKLRGMRIKKVQFDIIGVYYKTEINGELTFSLEHMQDAFGY